MTRVKEISLALFLALAPTISYAKSDSHTECRLLGPMPGRFDELIDVPLEDRVEMSSANSERQQRIEQEYQRLIRIPRTHTQVVNFLYRFGPLVESVAARQGLDGNLMKALGLVESGGNPKARSKREALGLYQFMRSAARRFGVRDRINPKESIFGAAGYLSYMKKYFCGRYLELSDQEKEDLVLLAYLKGLGGVEKMLKNHRTSSYWTLPQRTVKRVGRYVERVRAYQLVIERHYYFKGTQESFS